MRGAETIMLMVLSSLRGGKELGLGDLDLRRESVEPPFRSKLINSSACRWETMCSSLGVGKRRWMTWNEAFQACETSGTLVRRVL
jgi:hypothetical protein